MTIIDSFAVKEAISQGISTAKTKHQTILTSIVKKVSEINPLQFFTAGEQLFSSGRFFWKAASENNYLIGLGVCEKIMTTNPHEQFSFINKKWAQKKDSSLILGEQNIKGTGPLVFGGFSFDPLKEKTALWEKFADTIFYIPQFLLTVKDDDYYFTINIHCNPQDDEQLINNVLETLQKITENNHVKYENSPKIIKEIEINPEQWKKSITKAEQELHTAKTLKKVVLARELRLHFEEDVSLESTLDHLLIEQPDSYVFALQSEGDCFVGATPERLVKKEGDQILTTCLAGSIARGKTKAEDELLGNTLLKDEKNLIEHQYVVDMVKEAMLKTCDDVSIPDKPTLLKIRDIQHLYTPVVARGRDDVSLFTLVELLHPTPAIGGYPKIEAIEKIRQIEELDRGLYAGPIGWLDYNENGEFAVGLRSALVQGNEASLFAGCGVVVNSNAEAEYEETNIKFRPMLTALGRQK